MNEFLALVPFDVYELNLFLLVAEYGSFTKAGERAGLTQSAITRQIRGMEDRLGVALFERTTRHVALTAAGKLLFAKSGPILEQITGTLRQLQKDFHLIPKTLRVGVSRSIGLAYLPGFFFAFQKRRPEIQIQVVHQSSGEILRRIEAGELDAGLLSPPPRLARGLQITHRFEDEFTVIAPPKFSLPPGFQGADAKGLLKLFAGQRWLLIDRECNTGKRLYLWLGKQGLRIEPAMEVDTFDLIVNLVSLGMGVSLVPHRVLPLYLKSRAVQRIKMTPKFSRELVVVIRKNRKPPEQVTQFVESILF
ncbi:MAG: Transcriptional regulator, LysR family [Pedosphaera sp.]|nr:Transcriptional regulator, LysR family [Pedosphaera sp.]